MYTALYTCRVKTSIWLPDDIAEQWKASGDSLAELVRRGLAAGKPEPLDVKIDRIVDARLTPLTERLDRLPGADDVKRIIRDEISRAAGASHAYG